MFGSIKENCQRVAMTPMLCKKIKEQLGMEIIVESGAGLSAHYSDQMYVPYATVTNRQKVLSSATVIATVLPPQQETLSQATTGTIWLSMFEPFNDLSVTDNLKKHHIQAFSLDMIPRSTLAQAVDILSSMASIAGYKAVLLASSELSRVIPMLTTAAGTIKPASMLILGAGVAGLQAIATGRRLGAKVSAFDVRSSSKEEVQSLGAKFIEVEGAADDKGAGGYAVAQSEEFIQRQKDEIHKYASKADIIITTAQLRGRKAPLLIEDRTIAAMSPGSVIIDLAQKTGGNTSYTQLGKIVTDNAVVIIGDSDLADSIPEHASELLANNYFNFIKLFIKDGQINIDLANPILDASLITK